MLVTLSMSLPMTLLMSPSLNSEAGAEWALYRHSEARTTPWLDGFSCCNRPDFPGFGFFA